MKSPITSLTKQNLAELRKAMQAAVDEVAERFGVKINVGSATFQPSNATFKLTVATETEDGEAMTKEAECFRMYAPLIGLKPDDLFRVFNFRGDSYKLVGYAPKSRKFPILARRSDGRTFKFPEDSVKSLIRQVAGV